MSAAPGPPDPLSPSHGFVDGVASDVITTGRLESFSDGVMAVIITVMAFNLRPPSTDMVTAVEHRLPTLLIYMLSFTVIGIY